jgi:hypothetical protein
MTLSGVIVAPAPRVVGVFLGFFSFVLLGYAVLGRSFAYLGAPPLYIGEISLALGMVAALLAGNLAAAIFNWPGLMLLLLMIWTGFRTVPYLKQDGIDSLRDSVIVFYGLFSFVIASLILQRPRILSILIERYKRFAVFMVVLAPISLVMGYTYPQWPDPDAPVFSAKIGDLSLHLAGICAFALVGFIRFRRIALMIMLPTVLVMFALVREAMVSFVIGCTLAFALSPDRRAFPRFVTLVGLTVALVAAAAALDIRWSFADVTRQVSVRQMITNVVSIFSDKSSSRNESTKEWRLNWWSDIIDYTFHGPYFWTGKGFGVNLADSDGYQTSDVLRGEAPLRSPHNAHMTILARAGVPGLVLWLFALGSWLVAIGRQFLLARQLNDIWWTRVFAFLLSLWTALVVSSSFDVAFEGPVRGIWFWTIHGVGIAVLVLYRHQAHGRHRRGSSVLGPSLSPVALTVGRDHH